MKKNQSMQLRQNNKGREIRLVEIIQMYHNHYPTTLYATFIKRFKVPQFSSYFFTLTALILFYMKNVNI